MPVADLVILNARVFTVDGAKPRAEAVAVKDGRILAVGGDAEIRALAGPDTEAIDAGGGSVLPGFSENHMHLFSGAAELDHLQLGGVRGLEALNQAIRAYAAARPGLPFLFAQGCDYGVLGDGRMLDRHVLDDILPNQPFLVMAPDHHTAWANTIALEMSGILHGGQLHPGNEIVMGSDGLATGTLLEMEAFGPCQAAGGFDRYRLGLATGGEPDPRPDDKTFRADMNVMRTGLEWCARHGITTVQNMDGNLYQLALLAAIEREDGHLTCRVKIPFHYKGYMPLSMLDKAEEMTRRFRSDYLSSGFVKVFYDGVLDSHTAVMVDDYADMPGERGKPLMSAEHFANVAIEADRRGLQIAVHAIGDGAVRAVLDGYEAARKANGKREARHRIEHVEVIHPDDISRFCALGVLASMQPPHAPGAMDFPLEPTISCIGRERWPLSYAWRTLKEAGARIPFASDWPVSDINVLRGMQAAVTRGKWSESDPDQSFTIQEAIEGYTAQGAFAEFEDHRKGRIKPGFLADLVILSDDVEAVAPENMHHIHPVRTICGGRTTFSTLPDFASR
jgi:predicted amidohydrolase YtcJ